MPFSLLNGNYLDICARYYNNIYYKFREKEATMMASWKRKTNQKQTRDCMNRFKFLNYIKTIERLLVIAKECIYTFEIFGMYLVVIVAQR